MKKVFLFLFISLVLISCGTSKTTSVLNYSTPLPAGTPVEVFGIGQKLPNDVKFIGSISIGDSGFTTKCSYQEVINDAINFARGMGGNVIQITEHKEPNILCDCHRIKADVYYIPKN